MEAGKKAEALKEIGLKWLEEPIWPPENYDGLAELPILPIQWTVRQNSW